MKRTLLFLFVVQNFVFGQSISRIPYLQNVGTETITIRWRTDIAANCTVLYAEVKDTTAWKQEVSTPKTEHEVIINGLKPETFYFYKVLINNKIAATGKDYKFKTALPTGNKTAINLWVIGDFGDTRPVYLENQKRVAEQYLKQKNSDTDLWLWLGDNAYCCGYDTEYQAGIFDVFGSKIMSNTPFVPVLGNHDYADNPINNNRQDLDYHKMVNVPTQGERGGLASGTESYYAYNYGNTHFIALDSYGVDDKGLRLYDKASKQLKWLKADLEDNKQAWTIVYYHHPVYTKRSHNSDAEPELQFLRETLVPVFDQFGVDLVLSGHSHIYERSKFIKGHTGHSSGFTDAQYVVQASNGRFDATGCPYIKKDKKGIIYATVGSSGRVGDISEPVTAPAHPTSAYSNIQEGGSLLLKIEDNRLDARWITADGETKDQFTILKEVGRNLKLEADYGDDLNLTASWNGSYRWNTPSKNKNLAFKAFKNDVFIVKDSLGCLVDTFTVFTSPQPESLVEVAENEICDNKELTFKTTLKNARTNKFSYNLELSDRTGKFDKPEVLIKNTTAQTGKLKIPTTLQDGNYQIRLKPNVDFFKIQPSKSIVFKHAATAIIAGSQTVFKDSSATLEINLTGTAPWKFQLKGLNEQVFDEVTTSQPNNKIVVKATKNTDFQLVKVENTCGLGEIQGLAKLTVKEPLQVQNEVANFMIFPNPVESILTIKTVINGLKTLELVTVEGKRVLKNQFSTSSINLDMVSLKPGLYLLKISSKSGDSIFRVLKN